MEDVTDHTFVMMQIKTDIENWLIYSQSPLSLECLINLIANVRRPKKLQKYSVYSGRRHARQSGYAPVRQPFNRPTTPRLQLEVETGGNEQTFIEIESFRVK